MWKALCASHLLGVAGTSSGKVVHLIRHGTAEHNIRYNRRFGVFGDLIRGRLKGAEYDRRLFPEIEEWAYMTQETIDTSLVEKGVAEAKALGAAWADGRVCLHDRSGDTGEKLQMKMCEVDLIVTSPLTRTLQTTRNVFFEESSLQDGSRKYLRRGGPTQAAPIVALDFIKEWSQGRHTPNLRKPRSVLVPRFPEVDFGHLEETDELWKERWPSGDGLEPRSHLEFRVARFRDWLGQRPERHIVVVGHGTFLGNMLFGTFIEDQVELAHGQIYACRV